MLRVGLTGGIACGKTRVLQRLAARGCRTLDLDQAARDVVGPGSPALAEIEAAFGASVLRGGALDRAALAARVFADAAARARLNAIVHPRVWAVERRWADAQRDGAVRVVDAALLVETGAHLRFDRLVVVHCEPQLQLARLRARDGLDEAAARARIEAQMPLPEKRGFGNFEVDTSGSPAETDRAADALADTLFGLAAAPHEGGSSLERFVGGLLNGPDVGPRGLSPERVLAAADPERGIELPALAAALVPPATGEWYRAAVAEPALPASRLSVAIAAWAHCRRPADVELAMAAAASVARLVHVDPRPRTDACLVAGVAARLVGAGATASARQLAAELAPLGVRFGGGQPSGRLDPVWTAIADHPAAPGAAAALAASRGADDGTASALAGLAASFPESDRSAAWRGRLAALSAGAQP
jgi:dephospho-CoA kinase